MTFAFIQRNVWYHSAFFLFSWLHGWSQLEAPPNPFSVALFLSCSGLTDSDSQVAVTNWSAKDCEVCGVPTSSLTEASPVGQRFDPADISAASFIKFSSLRRPPLPSPSNMSSLSVSSPPTHPPPSSLSRNPLWSVVWQQLHCTASQKPINQLTSALSLPLLTQTHAGYRWQRNAPSFRESGRLVSLQYKQWEHK